MWSAPVPESRAVSLAMHGDAVTDHGRSADSRTDDSWSRRPQFEELYREHAEFIYRTAYGVTGKREDAEDVLQTVFLRLLRRDLPPGVADNLRGYLYRAAVNLSLDALRLRRRLVPVADRDVADLPAPVDPLDDTDHRRLYRAVAELAPEAAQILIFRYVHDKSDAEIARMLGVSRTTIAVRLFRSRVRLKKLLGGRMGVKS
jgi:RNA polymerase sigma-70 factor (ECF subfamily)